MEFWIGLSVGMHLGKVLADYLQRFIDAYGLLDATTVKEIKEIEAVEGEICSVVDAELSDD
jgi:hypothetical protein